MKPFILLFFWFLVLFPAFFAGCGEEDPPKENLFQARGNTYAYETVQCSFEVMFVDAYQTFFLTFENDTQDWDRRESVRFTLRFDADYQAQLLEIGEHVTDTSSTINHRYYEENASHQFSLVVPESRISLTWNSMEIDGGSFSGSGTIRLKQLLEYECADQITGEGGLPVGPGDPYYDAYYERQCTQGYYVPAQNIHFSCDGAFDNRTATSQASF